MGKSQAANVLRERCHDAVVQDTESPVNVVIDDTIVTLRSLGTDPTRPAFSTVEDVVLSIFRPAIVDLKHGISLFASVWDKQSYLNRAKEAEQDTRDAANGQARSSGAGLCERITEASGMVPLDPDFVGKMCFSKLDWSCAIADRSSRQLIIAIICRYACHRLPALMREMQVPTDRVLVIDYESYGKEAVSIELRSDPDMPTCSRPPVALGEFDVCCMHYARDPRVSELVQDPCVLLVSVDTDILLISMLDAEDPVHPVYVRLNTSKTYPEPRYFCPRTAVLWLRKQVPYSADAVADFVRVYTLAGSDFVQDGIYGVTNETFITQWLLLNEHRPVPPHEVQARLLREQLQKGGSSKRAQIALARNKSVHEEYRDLRAQWVNLYWRHSARAPELVPSCIGWGWSLKGDRAVYSETLLQTTNVSAVHAKAKASKRIKLMEEGDL